ncbi:uncharacterized protein JCM10292_000304 [Rhodotorula paludigena]|uniref:uncharacterized protein n=1 Tax=Rhodotorula paludigena TaxID=86838 RepID=UPI00316FB4AE
MSRRTSRARVSYVEVDSDVDIASSDDEAVQGSSGAMAAKTASGAAKGKSKGQGRMTGARKPAKKTRHQPMGSSEPDEAHEDKPTTVWNVELLLNLPVELLLEIVSQLDMSDLIHLASTSRSLPQLFVSRSGGKFWAAIRKKDAYNLPGDMSEIEFGLFLAGTHCEYCGATSATPYRHLRVRTCSECETVNLITHHEIRRKMSRLHKIRSKCVVARVVHLFIYEEVSKTSDLLEELEDQDEEARAANQSSRGWSTRSRRNKLSSSEPVEEDALPRFVTSELEQRRKEREEVQQLLARASALHQLRWKENSERKQKMERLRKQQLLSAHDWTQEQLDFWDGYESLSLWRLKPDADDPSQDPEGWLRFRQALQDRLEIREADRRAAPGRAARSSFLKDKFDELDWQDPRFDGILPSWSEFSDFKVIKALWHPEDAQLDDTTWDEQEPIVEQALIDFAERVRIHAIRNILAATSGKPLGKISSSPAKYSRDTDDEIFFSRATSLLGHRHYLVAGSTTRLVTFSTRISQLRGSNHLATTVGYSTSHQQVLAIRIVMEAAGVDPDAASKQDLDDLRGVFVWTDGKGKVWKYQSWMDMVHVLMFRAALVTKKRAGEKVDVEFEPVEENADAVDDGADDNDDGGGSSEPEDGEADEDEGQDEDEGAQEEGKNENDVDELDEEDEDDDA